MKNKYYQEELRNLQIELCKLQRHVTDEGLRLLVIFEGRDAAGKGGAIKRFTQYLPPREVHSVALPKPTERERESWYFQRYIPHLPADGEIIVFDRSWYNRAGVEPVMGFCSAAEHEAFLNAVPKVETTLVKDGLHLIKFWLDIDKAEQAERLHARKVDPLKQWKLSSMDTEAHKRWDAFSSVRNEMLTRTHHKGGEWVVVEATSKKRARLAVIRHVLSKFDYPGRVDEFATPDTEIAREFHPDMLHNGFLYP